MQEAWCLCSRCFTGWYSFILALLSATARRRARRLRASARLAWHLHKRGFRILKKARLQRVLHRLSAHHSKDPDFLRCIAKTMTSYETYPWKCQCGRINAKKAEYCPRCTAHWSSGSRHPTEPSAGNSRQSYVQTPSSGDWEYSHWQGRGSGSQSPRWRQHHSPRHRNQPTGKKPNRGRGKHRGHSQARTEAVDSYPSFGPPVAPPNPSDTPWLAHQPPLAPPPPPPLVMSAAEERLKEYQALCKKHQQNLPQEMQQLLKEEAIKQGEVATTLMHKQVNNLGKARKELEEAHAARLNLHTSWRTFLIDQVQRWQTYSANFQKQEAQLAERVDTAFRALEAAKADLVASKKSLGEASADDDNMSVNEEDQRAKQANDSTTSSAKKITEGLQNLSTSLADLKQQADQAVEIEQQSLKRPRISEVVATAPAQPPPDSAAQSFQLAGHA